MVMIVFACLDSSNHLSEGLQGVRGNRGVMVTVKGKKKVIS